MNALTLLDLCNQTYSNAQIIAGPLGRSGASLYTYPDGTAIVCIRGTTVNHDLASFLDWMTDLRANLVADANFPGMLHAGFRDVEAEIHPGVRAALIQRVFDGDRKWWRKSGNLFFIGHSLGGPIATTMATRYADLDPTVVTYGAPMPGDERFARSYPPNIRVVNYIGAGDLIPLLPGTMLPLLIGQQEGYTPVGELRAQQGASHAERVKNVAELIARWKWSQLHANHSLETGYRPWIEGNGGIFVPTTN